MEHFGPRYCEIASNIFPAEPINTLTNVAIFIAAAFAYTAIRRAKFPLDATALTILLLTTAIGSTLWHGLREPWALTLDVLPGLVFAFVFTYFWFRHLYGIAAGGLALAATIGMNLGAGYAASLFELRGFYLSFLGIYLLGLVFVHLTHKKAGRQVGQAAFLMLNFAAAAAIFRSVDIFVCNYIPFGSHFLWHILLATAGFLAIRLLLLLKAR